ncbi:MAG: hypothetical protein WC421_04200 [Elusimicrobiales bacterium]
MKNMLLIAALCAAAGPAGAERNIFTFTPYGAEKAVYTSNLNFTPDNEVSAWSNRLKAGFDAALRPENLRLDAGYSIEQLVFSRDQYIQNAVYHTANLGLDASLPKNIRLTALDSYRASNDAENPEMTYYTAKRDENKFSAGIEFPVCGAFFARAGGNAASHRYFEVAYDSYTRTETGLGGALGMEFAGYSVLGAWRHSELKYDSPNPYGGGFTNNGSWNNFTLGVEGKLGELSGRIHAGEQARDYPTPLNGADNSPRTFIADASAQWAPDGASLVEISASRFNTESLYFDSRYFTTTRAAASLRADSAPMSYSASFSFDDIKYPEPTPSTAARRSDQIARLAVSAQRGIGPAALTAEFAHTEKTSNETQWGYGENTFSLELKAKF